MFDGLDILGAIGATAVYAVMAGVLVGLSGMGSALKLRVLAVAAVWLALIVTLAALGTFAPGATGGLPGPVLAFLGFLGVLFGGRAFSRGIRAGLQSVPLSALVALNAARLGGVAFLMLEARGRMSGPFAPIAGGGDIAIAALAIPLAVAVARRPEQAPSVLGVWNVLGAVDLLFAVGLAVLSAPGTPFRVFTEGSGSAAFSSLPWVLVPATLVPLFFLIHFTIAVRLRAERRSERSERTLAGRVPAMG
jgi:hypothetical protein